MFWQWWKIEKQRNGNWEWVGSGGRVGWRGGGGGGVGVGGLPSPTQGFYSLSRKTSYRKISWSLEVARFGFRLFQLLWNLTGTSESAATLPRCLSNFSAKRWLKHSISRLRDFTRFGGKTSYRLVNRGPGLPTYSDENLTPPYILWHHGRTGASWRGNTFRITHLHEGIP